MGTPAIMFFIMMLALFPFAGAALLSNWLTINETPASDHMARAIALLMPLLLWLSAAFLAWLVVRWILIEPLVALQREVADYAPGKIIHVPSMSKGASKEIGDLSEAFHTLSKDVANHETEMMGALMRQKHLTREIHHRVKNNLQIISSLISLHWRAADDTNAAGAYLAIQRRVDALAVVQRNHYAELEEQKGVRAVAILNEIAAGLKNVRPDPEQSGVRHHRQMRRCLSQSGRRRPHCLHDRRAGRHDHHLGSERTAHPFPETARQ
jgi:two-component sensor histidine kinase